MNIQPQQVAAPVIWPQHVGLPAAQAAGPGGTVVQYSEQGYKAGGLTYCGFPRQLIAAGSTNVSVTIKVRRPFLPQLWLMPSTIYGLVINDFVIEGIGLFASPVSQGMPNELVSEVSNMPQIQWPTLDPSTNGEFTVSNPTADDLYFTGCFWGTNLLRAG